MFRFYLNNTLVSDPINWDDFTETIERDETIKGLLPKYEIKLKFHAGGYKYLYDLKQTAGFCNLVPLRVDYKATAAFETVLNGYIFLSDCKFNLNKKTVECDVIDNNFGARIYNNKSINIYLDSTLSKNNASISACGNKNVTFFKPVNGLDVTGLRRTYPVWNCLKYFVDFMSDGLIDFESDFLDLTKTQTDNPQRNLVITTGAILRGITGSLSPKCSFDTLFKEINKKYPIAFTMLTQSNGRPLIKIENESYFYGSDSGVKIENIEDLEQSINNRLLYSEIGIGGQTATYNASIHHVPDTIRMMFKEESYYFQTECNIDNKLDLVTTFICDSNIIEELVWTNTSNQSYDDSIFFVETSFSGGILGNRAIKTSLYDSALTPYYYNSGLTNIAISNNFSVYSDLIQYINSNDIGFRATTTTPYVYPYHKNADYTTGAGGILNPLQSSTQLIHYQDSSTAPNHDAGGNYTSTSRYTAPVDGHYYFKAHLKLGIETDILLPGSFVTPGNPNIMIRFYLLVRKYDVSNVLIETYTVNVGLTDFNTYKVFLHESTIYMNAEKAFFLEAGEYVETYFMWQSLPYKHYDSAGHYLGDPTSGRVVILNDSETYFETLSTESNGTLISGSSIGYNVEKLEFERPISDAEYKMLKQDLTKSLVVNHDGLHNKTAWIRKTTRKFVDGNTKLELISNETNAN